MSLHTWFTADCNATHTAWACDTTNANYSHVHFTVDTGTAVNTHNTHDVWNWVVADVSWLRTGDMQSIRPWSSKEAKKKRKEELEERYGVEELPKFTPEEAAEVEVSSERFLADVLSPDELVMFRAENKVRVESGLDPEVHYIVKRVRMSRIERYVDGKLVETLGFHACWQELPELDILATKVFDSKHNEALVLKESCRAAAPRVS